MCTTQVPSVPSMCGAMFTHNVARAWGVRLASDLGQIPHFFVGTELVDLLLYGRGTFSVRLVSSAEKR